LTSPPNSESTNLVSWADATPGSDNAVRFLVPVEIYRPRSAAPEAPPKDFASFLHGLTGDSAQISDVSDITVAGHTGTIMNLSRFEDESHPSGFLDGALGCPQQGADQFDGCFGPQPDLLLRLALVDVDEHTLLAWARVSKSAPDAAFIKMFEEMLTSIQFT
jgi:hypothetical protein